MDKQTKRLLKQGHLLEIHCACLIHDTKYDIEYVNKLYRALCRNLTPKVILHVFTESNRNIPSEYIKHDLVEWPNVRGPRKSWWYKVQIFDPAHYKGNMLYFDLDTVIVGNIDWIWKLPGNCFWAVKDFKHLFKNRRRITINSSVMWFNTKKYHYILKDFDLSVTKTGRFHGDQDYIDSKLDPTRLRYFDTNRIKSYKWEVKEGGYDFRRRKHNNPGETTWPADDTSVLVFHGNPNPEDENHPLLQQHWY